ncbi:MAG: anthranilate phosphoribosyltransferase [Candidatus Acidiferrales bacterium]
MIVEAIQIVEAGRHLTRREAEVAMEELLAGRANDAQIVALLAALRTKGETVDELVGFAVAMRRHAQPIFDSGRSPQGLLVDTCGTGGDAHCTFNVSTAAAFVVAGAGVRVAKHGNRSFSSKCGSADVVESLGVSLAVPPQRIGAAIEQVGIGFLFAPAVHMAMKHATAARRQLGGRTVFNLLGPLTNPAGATVQVLGVSVVALTALLAQALAELGVERAFVVHGADGLDEVSISAETYVSEVREGAVRSYKVTPEDFGVPRAPLEALLGGDAAENARIIRGILDGEPGPRCDIVLVNAAAALVAAGLAGDFREGAHLAAQSIDSGAAIAKLDALIAFTNAQPGLP